MDKPDIYRTREQKRVKTIKKTTDSVIDWGERRLKVNHSLSFRCSHYVLVQVLAGTLNIFCRQQRLHLTSGVVAMLPADEVNDEASFHQGLVRQWIFDRTLTDGILTDFNVDVAMPRGLFTPVTNCVKMALEDLWYEKTALTDLKLATELSTNLFEVLTDQWEVSIHF